MTEADKKRVATRKRTLEENTRVYNTLKTTLRTRINEFELSDDLTKLLSAREYMDLILARHGFSREWIRRFKEPKTPPRGSASKL